MSTFQPCASVSQLPAALRLPHKKRAPGFLNTYIVNLVDFHGFEVPLDIFSKSGQSSQMTMPARRASKFCAKRRSQCLKMFFLKLISLVIPGMMEPWPECQPKESQEAPKRHPGGTQEASRAPKASESEYCNPSQL